MHHQLIETRRKSDNRKMWQCTICEQEWTATPRIHCPGIPVVPWSKDHGTLRTMTQAKKEHYILPKNAKPVAALRLELDPWYVYLYDMSACEQKLPTEAQIRQAERREQTICEKYGCRLCTKRYLSEEAKWHENGVCLECRLRVQHWNDILAWARNLVNDPPTLLTLTTEPPYRAIANLPLAVYAHNRPLYQVLAYQSYDFATGELIVERPLSCADDYAAITGLLSIAALAGVHQPLFLFTGGYDRDLFRDVYQYHSGQQMSGEWLHLLTYLDYCQAMPLAKGWQDFPRDQEQSRYYRELCKMLGLVVAPDASVVEMLRQVVMHLASQKDIEL